MDKLSQDFVNSLIINTEDTIMDWIELGLDRLIEDDNWRDIPIVSNIVSVLKIGKNIHDRNLLKQLLVFLDELNNGSIIKDRLIAYQSTIRNNSKRCQEESERIIIYLNNFIDKEKSQMLAKLYKAYILQEINWDEFCEYSEIVNRLFIQDIEALKKVYIDNIINIDDFDNSYRYRLDRIASLGLINLYSKSKFSFGDEILDDFTIAKTKIGDKFVKIIINQGAYYV